MRFSSFSNRAASASCFFIYPSYFMSVSSVRASALVRCGSLSASMSESSVAYVTLGRRSSSSARTPVSIFGSPSDSSREFTFSFGGKTVACRRAFSAAMCACFARKRAYLSSLTSPASCPDFVRRTSALSCRRSRRYSEREVIILYGSFVPFVTKSSISVPIYELLRVNISCFLPCNLSAAFMPAISPCAAASS